MLILPLIKPVNDAVYVLSLFVRSSSVPPLTVTSSELKSLELSLNLNSIVRVLFFPKPSVVNVSLPSLTTT